MSAPPPPGRCLLLDGTPAETALLTGLPELSDLQLLSTTELGTALAVALTGGHAVDLVVVGSLTTTPVAATQHVHRIVPDAAVAVLSRDPAAVRRQVSFAPGIPLDLVVAAPEEPGLAARLLTLQRGAAERRRHAAVLTAVLRRSTAGGAAATSPLTAVGALLEHAPIAALVTTGSGTMLGWNRRAERLFDLGPDCTGRAVDDVLPGALTAVVAASAGAGAGWAADPETALQVSHAGRVLELSAVGSQTDEGRPVVLLFTSDVTDHREAEQERDRLAGHVQLLARVSESLMGRLDAAQPLLRMADALVPAMADWVSIQVRGEDGLLRNVAIRHRDPDSASLTATAERLGSRRGRFPVPSRRAAGGEVLRLQHISPDQLADLVPDAELRTLIARLGVGSLVAVPLPGRAGVLGSLLLVRAGGRRPFDDAELTLAVEVGRRAGITVDNTRLFAGQRDLATELQQSLLTDPPALPFADIEVRYVAAGREAQVGGDWYDAFRRRTGDLVIAIGDVVGHDSRAAAAMGQLRGILRGIAFSTADTPAQLLTTVDDAIEGLELATIASAVVAQISPPEGPGVGTALLRWSNAGHPAPLLLSPGDGARLLEAGSGKADLLLGIDPATSRVTEQLAVPAGSTVLLYTDGLVEHRGESLDDGLAWLLRAVDEHAAADLPELCDALLAGAGRQAAEDDIALVAVRLRPAATP